MLTNVIQTKIVETVTEKAEFTKLEIFFLGQVTNHIYLSNFHWFATFRRYFQYKNKWAIHPPPTLRLEVGVFSPYLDKF